VRQAGLGEEEGAVVVDRMHLAPLLRTRLEAFVVGEDARYVDEDVHASQPLADARHAGDDGGLARDVEGHANALGGQLRRQLLASREVEVDQSHVAARLR
jgi:hypothetical protein